MRSMRLHVAHLRFVAMVCATLHCCSVVHGQESLDRTRFDELFAAVQQDHDAPWRTIPWRIDLLAAQREAAASGRPLFVWAMDGHPLGCT